MRTYSHAALTYAALRLAKRTRREAALAALGATLPDLPAVSGAVGLWAGKRTATREDFDREVCGRTVFRIPDAAAHSFPVLLAALYMYRKPTSGRSVVLGWLGHILSDFVTHSTDARPQLWPLSGWRFESPLSYRERDRYGRTVTAIEHALLAVPVVVLTMDIRRLRARR